MGDKIVEVEVLQAKDGKLDLLIDGKRVTAYVSTENAKHWVTVNGQTFVLTKPAAGAEQKRRRSSRRGRTRRAHAGTGQSGERCEGESVTKGQTLLVVEAMKMEIRIQAPREGIRQEIIRKAGSNRGTRTDLDRN